MAYNTDMKRIIASLFIGTAVIGSLFYFHIPQKILNIENCYPSELFYVDEQVIEDQNKLEGHFEKLQDKQIGEKQDCWSYRYQKNFTKVLKQPIPSIIKIGIKKFKDPELFQMAINAGVRDLTEKEPVSMYYVDNYKDQWVGGEYDNYKKAITFKKGSPVNTLVHEYLHYVWYRDKLDNDLKLVGELTTFYKNSPTLQFRMKDYTSEMTKPTEFFSYGCTEFANRHLTPYIVEKCNKYIDRSKLRLYFQ